MDVEKLVEEAISGKKAALEGVVTAIQDNVYYLALRMLANPEDAKDATQEILIKIITNLSSFRFDSRFTTWVYRVAANYLISEKKVLSRDPQLTFDLYKQDLESDLQEPLSVQDSAEFQVLLNQLRISCTMAMLLCLDPRHRMAYILGDIYEMEHAEASSILAVSKENYRQQLSRARAKVVAFTASSCGLVSDCAKCSCEKKVTGSIARNRVDVDNVYFTEGAQYSYDEIKKSLIRTQQDLKALALQKSVGPYKSPLDLGLIIESLVVDGIGANKALYQENR